MGFDYTDEEIRVELAKLGIKNVQEVELHDFKRNLQDLIQADKAVSLQDDSSLRHVSETSKRERTWLQNGMDQLYSGYRAGDSASPHAFSSSVLQEPWQEAVADSGDSWRSYSSSNMGRSYSSYSMVSDMDRYSLELQHSTSSEPSTKLKSVKWKLPGEEVGEGGASADQPRARMFYDSQSRSNFWWQKYPEKGVDEEDDDVSETSISSSQGHSSLSSVFSASSGVITRKEPPHTRNLVRTSPFERHRMYQRLWRSKPPVSEASRASIYKRVHKRLLQKEEVKAPQKTLTPNQYVVPTTKPRYELRWAVRQCNENYEMPPCGLFPEA